MRSTAKNDLLQCYAIERGKIHPTMGLAEIDEIEPKNVAHLLFVRPLLRLSTETPPNQVNLLLLGAPAKY